MPSSEQTCQSPVVTSDDGKLHVFRLLPTIFVVMLSLLFLAAAVVVVVVGVVCARVVIHV